MTDVKDFGTEVLERSHSVPVLVDFWAEWCGPCRTLTPVLERLAGEAAGRWALAKVNTEEHAEVAAQYKVMSIPNVKLFVNGEAVDEFVGALPEPEVRRWLERALPSPHAAILDAAEAAIERGEFAAARDALRPVVPAELRDARAHVLLGRALLHLEPAAVEAVVALVPMDSPLADTAEALVTLARLAELATSAGALPPSAAREPLLKGARGIAAGDFGQGLEGIIESIRASRDYADGLAREAGRAVFVLLGLEHPIVQQYHRAFSSALYS